MLSAQRLRLRPRPQRRPQHLIRARHAQHAEIIEAVSDDLQTDRQSLRIVSRTNRGGRLFREIERCGEVRVFERRVIAGRCCIPRAITALAVTLALMNSTDVPCRTASTVRSLCLAGGA
jgi:hypothetical protein